MLSSSDSNFPMYQSWRIFRMRKSWLLCVLLGAMAWGQAPPGAASSPSPAQAPNSAAPTAEVPENAVVLTVFGVCPASWATAGAKTVAQNKTATAAAKTTVAKKPADCKTEITRREFEKIASGLAPNVTPQLKRQLAAALPKFMAMSEAAKAKGLEKTPQYEETLKIVKMQILTQQLQRSVQEEAEKVPLKISRPTTRKILRRTSNFLWTGSLFLVTSKPKSRRRTTTRRS